MIEITQKIRPTLYEMAVGDTVKFPISRLKSVRTQASELGIGADRGPDGAAGGERDGAISADGRHGA